MDSSRRAVESYWRSRMIDAATSDEDKVAPVYKLEEICDLLRSSHVSIVKEVSEFILKRLDHKSPIVKQKALRLIKYAVGKSGTEFRREIQRHSVAVRQLLHYRGHPDPLKGDALNKAVRETAQEAISAIFSEQQDEKVPVAENLNRRIEGFGNTNFKMPSEEKKSFLSEVVDIGSATIKQGLSSFTQGQSLGKNENGSYKSPNLRRSLTFENDSSGSYSPAEVRSGLQNSSGFSENASPGPWNPDMRAAMTEQNNGGSTSSRTGSKSREERLLETIVTSGGVRLQPTRDAIQVFLREAAKLDSLALSHALEGKLGSPHWQVRLKAVCVLDAIVRKREEEPFSIISSYFGDNKDVLIRCSESPQASLRDKANKVLSLFGGGQEGSTVGDLGRSVKAEKTTAVEMPDLIDTSDPDATHGTDDSEILGNLTVQPTPLVDDLFGDGLNNVMSPSEQKTDEDPFADVSFHTSEVVRESTDDIFTGMSVSSKGTTNGNHVATSKNEPASFDLFGFESEVGQENNKDAVNDLMAGLSIENNAFTNKQKADGPASLSESIYSDLKGNSVQQVPTNALNQLMGSQTPGLNANAIPSFTMPYGLAPGMMVNPAQSSQQINYATMGNILAQQQFLAAMSNLQQYAAMNSANSTLTHASGTTGGSNTSPIPDIFQAGYPGQAPTSTLNMSKKPDTKAFDFISDHIAAARDPKRMG